MASIYSILITAHICGMQQIDFTSSLILEIELYGKTSDMVVLETPLLGTQRQSYACSNRPGTKGRRAKKTCSRACRSGQSDQIPCTFRYEGGFMVLLISFPAYGGMSEIAPIARTRQ